MKRNKILQLMKDGAKLYIHKTSWGNFVDGAWLEHISLKHGHEFIKCYQLDKMLEANLIVFSVSTWNNSTELVLKSALNIGKESKRRMGTDSY